MPAAYKRCVEKVGGGSRAHAICTKSDAGGIKAYRKKESLSRKAQGKSLGR